jgi:hypothetical protein
MGTNEIWTQRLTSGLRAMGIAVMVVILGKILLALADMVGNQVGAAVFPSVATALLLGYAGGRRHAWWKQLVTRTPRTIRSEEFQVRRKAHVPSTAPSGAALTSELTRCQSPRIPPSRHAWSVTWPHRRTKN